MYSLFEHNLFLACLSLQRFKGLSFSAKDFRGSGIDQAKQFIKKGIGIGFPDQTTEWQIINSVRRIRNRIVHEQGTVYSSRDNSELEKAVEAVENVSIDDHQIIVDHQFGQFFGRVISKFFDQLSELADAEGNEADSQ